MSNPPQPRRLTFRAAYIALPLTILSISVLAAVIAYASLPDSVAYHFRFDGSPDRWAGKTAVITLTLLPQFFFTVMAAVMPLIMLKILSLRAIPLSGKIQATLMLMGNLVALPQALLCFAMLDIIGYNSLGIHILPLWAFAILVALAGIFVIGWFFWRILKQKSENR